MGLEENLLALHLDQFRVKIWREIYCGLLCG